MQSDIEIYCNQMEELKVRFAMAKEIIANKRTVGREDFDGELIAVQIRKILELIAFSTLVANRSKYSEVYADFAEHWSARKLFERLEKLHSQFYPVPIEFKEPRLNGVKIVQCLSEGFLIKEEFIQLYQICSKVMHVQNPFHPAGREINLYRSFDEWLELIKKLLMLHRVVLAGRSESWIVYMEYPEDRKVHAFTTVPYQGNLSILSSEPATPVTGN